MGNKNLTAVEWLVNELTNLGYIYAPSFGHAIIDGKIEQAKQMEKEQIECAYDDGYVDGFDYGGWDDEPTFKDAENYYNVIFKL